MAAALLCKHLLIKNKANESAIVVSSAGIQAGVEHASIGAIDIMRSYGINLKGHMSEGLSSNLIQWADLILTMSGSGKTYDRILKLKEKHLQ